MQGGQLETSLGSVRFACLVAELLVASQLLLLFVSVTAAGFLPFASYHQVRSSRKQPASRPSALAGVHRLLARTLGARVCRQP